MFHLNEYFYTFPVKFVCVCTNIKCAAFLEITAFFTLLFYLFLGNVVRPHGNLDFSSTQTHTFHSLWDVPLNEANTKWIQWENSLKNDKQKAILCVCECVFVFVMIWRFKCLILDEYLMIRPPFHLRFLIWNVLEPIVTQNFYQILLFYQCLPVDLAVEFMRTHVCLVSRLLSITTQAVNICTFTSLYYD